MKSLEYLEQRAGWVRRETLRLHQRAPGTRVASSLSSVEIFVVLYYGRILRYRSEDVHWEDRDRLVVSKGHGATSLYPILADLGFFPMDELTRISQPESFLGIIPDARVPGIETINGSLGHGLGVACGMAVALKRKGSKRTVFVVTGDGELNSGSVWEGVMFAAYHRLDNLIMIVDNNRMSMLGFQKDILGLEPLADKFRAFGWMASETDGHRIGDLYEAIHSLTKPKVMMPRVLIADTIKGKGVCDLENDPLCHVKSLPYDQIEKILGS